MNILALDLGGKTGVVLYNTAEKAVDFHETYKIQDIGDFGDICAGILRNIKFDVVVTSYPTRFYNVIVAHAKQMGVLEYLAYKLDKLVIYTNDSTAKKLLFGKGKLDNKDIKYLLESDGFSLATEHEYDALMFARAYEKEMQS